MTTKTTAPVQGNQTANPSVVEIITDKSAKNATIKNSSNKTDKDPKPQFRHGEGDERAKIQKEFDTLKSTAERDLKQYSFNHQMLERLERLDEFNKKATPEQKKKFVQLLQCEWEPL